ncbi:MAG: MBL fold metallo-hydrolase [Candidatus Acidiferrales bacterium]
MSRVELRLLGTGDAFGSGGRLQTCFHLSGAGGALLLDCGATALIALQCAGLDPNRIGWVLLTHLHGDHFGGLPFFILDAQFNSHRTQPLIIAGPPGVAARLEATMEALYPGSAAKQRKFETSCVELQPRQPAEVGPARVTPYPVAHPSGAPAYALRVEYGSKVVAYSGDTEWTEALVEAARGADLFLCECCFLEPKARYHLDYQTLKEKRPLLDCRRLLLTHLGKEMHEHLKEIEFEVAVEGQLIVL